MDKKRSSSSLFSISFVLLFWSTVLHLLVFSDSCSSNIYKGKDSRCYSICWKWSFDSWSRYDVSLYLNISAMMMPIAWRILNFLLCHILLSVELVPDTFDECFTGSIFAYGIAWRVDISFIFYGGEGLSCYGFLLDAFTDILAFYWNFAYLLIAI